MTQAQLEHLYPEFRLDRIQDSLENHGLSGDAFDRARGRPTQPPGYSYGNWGCTACGWKGGSSEWPFVVWRKALGGAALAVNACPHCWQKELDNETP